MSMRTSKKTITFKLPFTLDGPGEVLPAGYYVVETEEELLESISFPAYRRVSTQIHLHPSPGVMQKLTVDPKKLAAALRRDQATAHMPADEDSLVQSEQLAR